jgi:type VII secretion protein EccB
MTGMQSRRDQVQAQSYVLGRLTAALVMAEPEAMENPHRRMLVGTIAGAIVAALVVAGFTVFGFLRPGGASSWRAPGTVVVEKETGSRYVLVGGALRPILNYTSAVLLFGKRPAMVSVSTASLRSVPRGVPVGIVGAPDALPGPAGLDGVAWTVCAAASRDQAGTLFTATTLTADRTPASRPLDDAHGIAVRAPGGQTFLIWRGRRYQFTSGWLVRAFGYDAAPVPVEPGWLDQLPVASDIAPISVPGRGTAGPVVDGQATMIGQLFVARVAGTAERYYLLQRDGLSELSVTGVAVMSSDPGTAQAYGSRPVQPTDLTAAALAALPTSAQPAMPADLPAKPPAAAASIGSDRLWCTRRAGSAGQVQVTAEPLPVGAGTPRGGVGISRTAQTADAVIMAPGVGGLVRLGRAGQASGSSYFVVTDAGVMYPLAAAPVAGSLGYPLERATILPPGLLALLPTGPVLDPDQARR